jgi:uncharacterized iron-regulated membrane protein
VLDVVLAIWVISLVASALTLVDQVRRPSSEWTAADRDRSYWIGATAVAGLFACGLLAALVYAIGVLPRFAGAPPSDAAFSKRAAHPNPTALQSVDDSASAPAIEGSPGAAAPRKLVVELDDV